MTDSFRPPTPRFSGLRAVGGLRLWADWFEPEDDDGTRDPVLLLSEAEAPATRWSDRLVAGLLDEVGPVLRFDTRDTGRSDDADEPYGIDDLALDAVRLLDLFGLDRVHVVGRSMGGMVAQVLGLDHVDRVASLTLLSTTGGQTDDLPLPVDWLVDRMAERHLGVRPADDGSRLAWIVEQAEWFSGTRWPFDPSRAAAEAAEELAWWRDATGHGAAVVEAEPRWDRLPDVGAPTVVVHGTADPVHPPDHAIRLADAIPDARLELVEGLGHELPDDFTDRLVALVAEAAARAD